MTGNTVTRAREAFNGDNPLLPYDSALNMDKVVYSAVDSQNEMISLVVVVSHASDM